jgi:hypothetical protein
MMAHQIEIFSPASGKAFPLEEVPDELFSAGLMGPGLAIMLDVQRLEYLRPAGCGVFGGFSNRACSGAEACGRIGAVDPHRDRDLQGRRGIPKECC